MAGEWVAQLVGQDRQRLACSQRPTAFGIVASNQHLTDLPLERMGWDRQPASRLRQLFFLSSAVFFSVAALHRPAL